MGYARYTLDTGIKGTPKNRGYAVSAVCRDRFCDEKIDRGLGHLCYRCTNYFCGKHLEFATDADGNPIESECFAGKSAQMCGQCHCFAIIEDKAEKMKEKRERLERVILNGYVNALDDAKIKRPLSPKFGDALMKNVADGVERWLEREAKKEFDQGVELSKDSELYKSMKAQIEEGKCSWCNDSGEPCACNDGKPARCSKCIGCYCECD